MQRSARRLPPLLLLFLTSWFTISSARAFQPSLAEDKLRFADGLYSQSLYKLAVREYSEFIRTYPRHAQVSAVRLRLGDAHMQEKQYEEAVSVLSDLLQSDPSFEGRLDAAYRLGRCQIEVGRFQEAVRVLSGAQKNMSGQERKETTGQLIAYWLAEAYFRSNQPDKALATLERLLAGPVDADLQTQVRYTAAWSAFKAKEYEKAVGHFQGVIGTEAPADTRAECHYMLGESRFELEDYPNALRDYTMASRVEGPYQDDAALARGWCLFESGKFARAGDAFKAVVDSFPDSEHASVARLRSGISYFQASKYDDAGEQLLQAANDKDPAIGPEAHYWLSMVLLRQNKTEEAVQFLSRVRTSDDRLRVRVSVALGEALFRLERHKDALRALSRVTSQITAGELDEMGGSFTGDNGSLAYALHASALSHQALEQHREASAMEATLLEKFPKSSYGPAALLVQGESLYAQKEYEDAAQSLTRLLEEHPKDENVPAALYKLGWCHYELESYGDARRAFVRLKARHPDNPLSVEAAKLAGQCLARMGKKGEAIQELESVSRSGGEVGDFATLELARLQRDKKDLSASVQSYARLAEGTKDPELKARALYEQGEVYYEARAYPDAATSYGTSLEAATDVSLQLAALDGLCWSLYRAGDFESAGTQARRLLSMESIDGDLAASTLNVLGACHQKLGKWDVAISAFTRLLGEFPKSALAYEANFGLGVSLASAGRHREAAEALEGLLRQHPEGAANDRVLYELAFVYKEQKNDQKMASSFQRILKDYPKSPLAAEVKFRLGEYHYASGSYEDAARSYDGVSESGASAYLDKALYKKGWAERKSEKNEEAVTTFTRLVEECPQSALRGEALYLRGDCLRGLGKPDDAQASFKTLLSEYPEHALIERGHLELGLAQVESEGWTEAVRTLTRHRQKYPESERLFEVDFWLGKSLQALKRHASAIQTFRRVTASYRGETAARAQYEIGQCLRTQNDHENALNEYLRVRFLYGHDEWVAASMFRCAQCFEQLKQTDRAAETYTELTEKYPDSRWSGQAKDRLKKLGEM